MILRRISEAIKRQDWFVVLIEIMIVVVGLFIGLQFDDWDQKRQREAETIQALLTLRAGLELDLERLDEVTEVQQIVIANRYAAAEMAHDPNFVPAVFSQALYDANYTNDTLYPNTSAYGEMQAAGYISALPDVGLKLILSRLFEREYVRLLDNGYSYDNLFFSYQMHGEDAHWDKVNHHFIGDEETGRSVIANGLISLNGQGEFYLTFMVTTVRPTMLDTIAAIDAYVSPKRGDN